MAEGDRTAKGTGALKGSAAFCRNLELASAVIAVFLLIVNIGDIVLGIVMRYCFAQSIIWTEEVARYSLVWLAMLGAAGACARGDQMAVDFLVPHFPLWLRFISRVTRVGVQVCVLCVLIWFGVQNVGGTWRMKTMALGIPKALPLMAVPIGMSMLLAQILAQEWRDRTRSDAESERGGKSS
ncbi:MAG: TRAP transporter small permease [Synergistaceae bacterium]|jgi:TRAP-type C4-dicarboxylate transport system permease small subunit|nr:TRAP transporter small permease [Synergistaceae bacterium]